MTGVSLSFDIVLGEGFEISLKTWGIIFCMQKISDCEIASQRTQEKRDKDEWQKRPRNENQRQENKRKQELKFQNA